MVLKIIGIAFLGYFVYGMTLFSVQRTIMYPRKHIPFPAPIERICDTIRQIWLPVSRARVEAWYIPVKNGAENQKRPVVIFAHGNVELIDYCVDEFLPYHSLGMDVLLVEYPGYGRSEGRPSQHSITEIFVAAYDWLCTQNNYITECSLPDSDKDHEYSATCECNQTPCHPAEPVNALIASNHRHTLDSFYIPQALPGDFRRVHNSRKLLFAIPQIPGSFKASPLILRI
jgi:hypothetical protein